MNKLICQKCGNKENTTNNLNIYSNCEKIKRLEQAKIICRSIGLTVLIMFIPLLIFPTLKGADSSVYYKLPVEAGKSIFSYRMLVLPNILLILLAVISFSLPIFFKLKIKNTSKVICFLLFFALIIPLSAQSKSKDTLVFEITDIYSNNMKSSSTTFYFYQSGRIDCQKYNRDFQKNRTGKKIKCFQTSAEKISELANLAESSDFKPAKESYILFSGGYDWGRSFYIDYLTAKGKKTIKLGHSRFGDDGIEAIPFSLKMFLQKIGEIDEKMKIQYSFPKPNRNNLPQDFL